MRQTNRVPTGAFTGVFAEPWGALRGWCGEQRGSVSSTHRTPKSFFHRAPQRTQLWKCSFRDVSRCAHGPPPEASRFIRPTSTVALTAPAPGALSHSPWSKTPRYSDFSFLPPARSAPSQGTHDLRFPKDMAHVVGRAIMNITGILPIPASPEELCLGCRPLGLQGQVFLERGRGGASWGRPETSTSARCRVGTHWDLRQGGAEERVSGSGKGQGPSHIHGGDH